METVVKIIMLLWVVAFPAEATEEMVFTEDNALLIEIRQNLSEAFQERSVSDRLFAKVKAIEEAEPLLWGYIGAVYFTRAKHVSIFNKMGAFRKGKKYLEKALEEAPDELELHFLRMTIQINLPGFLGYNDHIDEDKKFVLDHFETAKPKLRSRIANYVEQSEDFSAEEKALIKSN